MQSSETNPRGLSLADFEDTQLAFSHLGNFALLAHFLVFATLKNKSFVSFLTKLVLGLMKLGVNLDFILKKTIFPVFCGGTSAHECLSLVQTLDSKNTRTTLDFAVEAGSSAKEFDQTKDEVLHCLDISEDYSEIDFIVFKATGLCSRKVLEDTSKNTPQATTNLEWKVFQDRVKEILERASSLNAKVLVDAEETWFQQAIDNVVLDSMRRYNKDKVIVFHTVQMYRKDRLQYLDELINLAKEEGFYCGFKIVRGAYLEKENHKARVEGRSSPIHASKADCDQAFDKAVSLALENLNHCQIYIATHNEESVAKATQRMQSHGIPPNDERVVFSQLFGMGDNLSFNLAKRGYRVSKYVPFGPVREIIPYLARRASENSSVQGQTGRELRVITKEISRRWRTRSDSNARPPDS